MLLSIPGMGIPRAPVHAAKPSTPAAQSAPRCRRSVPVSIPSSTAGWHADAASCSCRPQRHVATAAASSHAQLSWAEAYAVLGLAPHASEEDIRAAWKAKAKQLHPDINKQPGAAEAFMRCKDAHDTLLGRSRSSSSSFGASTSSSGSDGDHSDAYEQPQWERAAYAADDGVASALREAARARAHARRAQRQAEEQRQRAQDMAKKARLGAAEAAEAAKAAGAAAGKAAEKAARQEAREQARTARRRVRESRRHATQVRYWAQYAEETARTAAERVQAQAQEAAERVRRQQQYDQRGRRWRDAYDDSED